VLLTETEMEESIRLLFEQHRLVVEGSGALGVGGLLKPKRAIQRKESGRGRLWTKYRCVRSPARAELPNYRRGTQL
jgi:threonine dehydratase